MIVRQQLDQAMEDFKRNHPASQRYMSIATPLLAVGQGLVFVSQFSAIATLASNKVCVCCGWRGRTAAAGARLPRTGSAAA
jgi:hypothetical protein